MISDYRLVRNLVKLKSFKQLQKATKTAIKQANYQHCHRYQKFFNNRVSNLKLFNHCFSIFGYFQDFDITKFSEIIADFNLLVSSAIPLFNFQNAKNKHYHVEQKNFLKTALSNPILNQWYEEALITESEILKFFSNQQQVPLWIVNQIKVLCYLTGKMFANLVAIQTPDDKIKGYKLGYNLMLFYLLDFETRQVIINRDITNWNLASYFEKDQLFSYKLLIIDDLTKKMMHICHKNFNLYWRVINFVLNKSYE